MNKLASKVQLSVNVPVTNEKKYGFEPSVCESLTRFVTQQIETMSNEGSKIDPIEAAHAHTVLVLVTNIIRGNQDLSPASRRSMLSYIKNMSPEFVLSDFREITGLHIQREFLALQARGIPPIQAARRIWSLRSSLKRARDMGLKIPDSVFTVRIAAKDAPSARNKKAIDPEKVLQAYQAAAVDKSLKEVDRVVCATFVLSVACGGSRIGDTVRLKQSNLQDGRVRFLASKNGYQVDLPFTPRLLFALHALKGTTSGEYLTPWLERYEDEDFENVQRATARLQTRLRRLNVGGLNVQFHDSRRIVAMMLSEQGHAPSTVANAVGWHGTKMVHKYARHQTQETVDDAFKNLG